MNYTSILRRAAEITWRHRALWLFGILLAIFSGGGGNGGGGGGSGSGASQSVQYQLGSGDLSGLQMSPQAGSTLVLLVVLAVLAFVLVMIVLSVVVGFTARGALIGMVDEVERTGTTSIASGFRSGWARFLRLFAISLVVSVPVTIALMLLLVVLVGLPVVIVIIASANDAVALAILAGIAAVGLFLLWLLLAIVTGAVVEALSEVMYRRCVLGQEGVFESIREGYWMVRRHLRDVGLTWLILFGINLVYGIVTVPVAIIGLGLAAAPGIAAWALAGSPVAGVLAALPFLLIVIAALVVVQGIYLVFRSAVWTLMYREITAGGTGADEAVEAPAPEDDGEGEPVEEPSGE